MLRNAFLNLLVFSFLQLSTAQGFSQPEAIEFGDQIETCLSAEVLWQEFSLALVDSESSALWPNSKSIVRGDGLSEGGSISVKYYLNFFYRPVYNYVLTEIIPLRGFTYTASEDHPFVGGAKVEIVDGGSVRLLSWQGSYLVKNKSDFARKTFKNFANDFFLELRLHLQNIEDIICSR